MRMGNGSFAFTFISGNCCCLIARTYSTINSIGSPEAESPATHNWNLPDSTTYSISRFQKAKSDTGRSYIKCLVSPGLSVTRIKPLSSLTGRTTEPTRSRT